MPRQTHLLGARFGREGALEDLDTGVSPTIVLVGHLSAKGGRIARAARSAAALFRANGFHTEILPTESSEHRPEDPRGWGEPLRQYLDGFDKFDRRDRLGPIDPAADAPHKGTAAGPAVATSTGSSVASSDASPAASAAGASVASAAGASVASAAGASVASAVSSAAASPGVSAVAAVVAVGGDGMAHLVLNILLERQARGAAQIPFGLIASGSGNDLARHWNSPHDDPERAAGRILRRLDLGASLMDVGQVSFEDTHTVWFATALCAGIDAAVNHRANRWKRPSGSIKYLGALAVEVIKHPPHRYHLEVTGHDGQSTSRELAALMVNVANTSSIGGGLRIVPHADPTDHRLELFVVKPLSRLRFLRLFPSIYTGEHVHVAEVEITSVPQVRIIGEHVVFADGEPLGRLPATVKVLPAALPVLL